MTYTIIFALVAIVVVLVMLLAFAVLVIVFTSMHILNLGKLYTTKCAEYDEAQAILDEIRKSFEDEPCDCEKCVNGTEDENWPSVIPREQ